MILFNIVRINQAACDFTCDLSADLKLLEA